MTISSCSKNSNIKNTKEVVYRKIQGIGLPYLIHLTRIIFNQMTKERTSIMTGAEEVSFSLKGDPIGRVTNVLILLSID